MRRADRLFQIIQILRRSDLTTAAQLASELEVSVRTVYRDIRDLMASGIPIEGEAGVGYILADGYDLPPLMFTHDEIEALVLGARMVTCWGDDKLAQAAEDILAKVDAVVPEELKKTLGSTSLYSLNFSDIRPEKDRMKTLRQAIRQKTKIRLHYRDAQDDVTTRTIRPLCLAFFAPRWMLTAWCELRHDFRNFRLDRIERLDALAESFPDERGKTLDDFFRKMTDPTTPREETP